MFRKFFIFAMLATAAGYCFAMDNNQQIVTSEVFYSQEEFNPNAQIMQNNPVDSVPVWPLVGSDADVTVGCENGMCGKTSAQDNIRIVSKIGNDLIVENNFNLGGVRGDFGGWSGGANMLHGNQIPVGFANDCANGSEMPLLHREMLEDDGASVLAVSRSSRPDCTPYADGYSAFMAKSEIAESDIAAANAGNYNALAEKIGVSPSDIEAASEDWYKAFLVGVGVPQSDVSSVGTGDYMPLVEKMGVTKSDIIAATNGDYAPVAEKMGVSQSDVAAANTQGYMAFLARIGMQPTNVMNAGNDDYMAFMARMGVRPDEIAAANENWIAGNGNEIAVNITADAEPATVLIDQVRSWVVANGQTLREVLQDWCNKEGWDLVWTTSREYPIEASAVFRGRFVDVASALVRNFARATPVPYAKFYKGNRVLVISTTEE